MREKKIVFVVMKKDPIAHAACLASIQALRVPAGYVSQTVTIQPGAAIDFTVLGEQIRQQTLAGYYIYLDEAVCFVDEDFLTHMLAVFQTDAQIGALGMAGAKQLPLSGNWREAGQKFGAYYYAAGGQPIEKHFIEPKGNYEAVQGLDCSLLAVRELPPYEGKPLPGSTAIAWRQSLAAELRRAGWRLAVPRQVQPWCLYSQGEPAGSVEPAWLAEYAGYLAVAHEAVSPECLLDSFGGGTFMAAGYRLDTPAGIRIGAAVRIGRDAWLGLPYANAAGTPRIEIGDGCDLGPRCVISAVNHVVLERGVSTAENVRLADYSACCADAGLPIHQQGAARMDGEIVVGAGSHLGANVVVEGSIHIGCGCLVEANSIIRENIPDYCVVSGSPARVVKLFDWERNQWDSIGDGQQLAEALARRRKARPVLTIGIPTYNRSYYLNKCLRHVFAAIGGDAMFEVYVSDNASTDNTAAVVQEYAARYGNLRYARNAENIGPTRNFLKVWQSARGEYVMALGDDDYLKPLVYYELVKAIYEDRQAAIVALLARNQAFETVHLSGINAYVATVSYVATSITSVVYRKADFDQLPDYSRFLDTELHQIAIQMEVLHRNGRFSLLLGDLYAPGDGESVYITPADYEERKKASGLGDLGKIFIQEYLDILGHYRAYGLTEACLKEERYRLLTEFILPWSSRSASRMVRWGAEHVLEYYDLYYKDEAYYQEKRAALVSLLQK